jgi:hypothetical protein
MKKKKQGLKEIYWMPRDLLTKLIHALEVVNNSDKLVTSINIRKDMRGYSLETVNNYAEEFWDTKTGIKRIK